jgi:putrescine aminotransferase
MGATRMRRPFEPLLRGCSQIPYGDADALNAALTDRVAAFVVEPIQAEAGVILPPAGYLARAQKLCRQRGAVLILDEVQTGLGRTGPLFAYQAEGFVPDALVLAKALGGGVAAIGATIVSRELHRRAYGAQDRFDLHSSTFAGHAIACAAACAALEVVTEGDLLARSRERGDRLRRALADRLRGHPMVRDVRGRGMLIGVELGAPASRLVRATVEAVSKLAPSLASATAGQFIGQWIAVRLLEAGVLCQPAAHQWDVLKIEPPLVIDDADVDRLVAAVGGILDEYRTLRALLKDVGLRVAAQKRAGWRW